MKKLWMPAMLASLILVMLAASPVFGSFSTGGAEPSGKDNPGPPIYYVVQFKGPIEQEWKDQVTQRGGELLGYIPQFAFKVRMNPAQARKIEELESVGAVLPFLPDYKLSPRLAAEGTNLYRVKVERGADAGLVAAAIAKTGAEILMRQGNILLLAADAKELRSIAEISDVAWVDNFAFHEKHNEYGAGVIMGANVANTNGYNGSTQTVAVADTGLGGGTGGTAHADIPSSRISAIHSWFNGNNSCWNVVQDGARDVASGHGTHVAGSVLSDGGPSGEGKGTAPAAKLIFQAVEDWTNFKGQCAWFYIDGYYLIGIPTYLPELYQQAYDDGARIHSNSWGSQAYSEYTVDSADTDGFIWNNPDMTITFSAGNDAVDLYKFDGIIDTCDPSLLPGSNTCWMSSPATAKNVITVGASENQRQGGYPCDTTVAYPANDCSGENVILAYSQLSDIYFTLPWASDPMAGNSEQMTAFSARGPTSDGRIKPDVVAPGTYVLSAYSDMFQEGYDGSPNPQNGAYQYDGWGFPYDEDYKFMGGTSMSNPLVAGGAAVVRDYYQKAHSHSASAALVKATLINSAVDMLDENNDGVDDNDYPIPNPHEGWGRVNLDNATDGSHEFVEETTGLGPGGSREYEFTVEGGSPFKVSLVWSDYPSMPLRDPAGWVYPPHLVNDLDLVVTSPSAIVYRGNNFSGGWTQPGGSADQLNNVENVYIQSAASGTWKVKISGYNIPMGPQPYALVVDGAATPNPPPDTEAPSVTVQEPASGETWTAGTSQDITWAATDNLGVTSVDLYYSVDDGASFIEIATGQPNTSPYTWAVTGASPANQAFIKVMAHDAAGYTGQGMSDAFSINEAGGGSPDTDPPEVTVQEPASGATWIAGTNQNITWAATDNVGVTSVDLYYSVDDGASFIEIATGQPNTSPYTWAVTGASPANQGFIKVMAHDAAGYTGEGMSAAFSIVDSGGGGPTETITITKATYNSRKNGGTLDIQATSSEGASPILTATYLPDGDSPVNMTYSSKKDKWSIKITGVSEKPASVQVCSFGTLNCDEKSKAEIGGK